MKYSEIFISYRRSDSVEIAESLYEQLEKFGRAVFWDKKTLESGDFSKDIENAIKHCEHFLLIINYDTLTRCSDKKDWLRKEVVTALKHKKNIVPLFIKNNYEFPKDLPSDMDAIKTINGIPNFEVDNIKHINELLTKRLNAKSIVSDKKDFKISNGVLKLYKGNATIIEIPKDVKIIGKKAFNSLTRISKITFNNKLVEIQDNAFERCLMLETIEFPSSLKKIGTQAFLRCSNLKSVKFNDELEEIGKEAFKDCSALKIIRLGSKLKSMGNHIFCDCNLLENIEVDSKNINYSSNNGLLYNNDKSKLIYVPISNNNDKIVIKNDLTEIGKYAFYRNKCKTIDFKGKVLSVNDFAFAASTIKRINSVNIPDNISLNAFMGNENINTKWNAKKKKKDVLANDNIKSSLILFKYIAVITTFESEQDANMMATILLEKKLIVAAQVRKIRSMYIWDNKVCNEPEYELQVFTEGRLYDVLEKTIKENHQYDVPQIICLPMINTTNEWGKWLSDYVGG